MSESNTILSIENLPTIVVVTFTLALVSIAFNVYSHTRSSHIIEGVAALEQADADEDLMLAKAADVSALEARLSAMEAKMAAMEAAAPATADASAK